MPKRSFCQAATSAVGLQAGLLAAGLLGLPGRLGRG